MDEDEAIVPRLSPGDALLFLGSTLHGGGGNVRRAPRRGIVVSYCLGWPKPFELQWLVSPPAIARRSAPDLAALVAYAPHRTHLGTVSGHVPYVLVGAAFADHFPAIQSL